MAKGKKISRKQLLKEPDEILTTTARLFQFTLRHRYPILFALAGLILIVLVVSAVRYHRIARENESFAVMQVAWQNYRQQEQAADAQTAYQAVAADFEALLKRFEGTTGAKYGKLVFADISFEAGKTDQAIALYQEALDDVEAPEIRNRILNGLAYAYEARGDAEAAIEHWRRILAGRSPAFQAEARFNLGRLYAELGDTEESRAAFETLLAENPDSLYATMVRERLATGGSTEEGASAPEPSGD